MQKGSQTQMPQNGAFRFVTSKRMRVLKNDKNVKYEIDLKKNKLTGDLNMLSSLKTITKLNIGQNCYKNIDSFEGCENLIQFHAFSNEITKLDAKQKAEGFICDHIFSQSYE